MKIGGSGDEDWFLIPIPPTRPNSITKFLDHPPVSVISF